MVAIIPSGVLMVAIRTKNGTKVTIRWGTASAAASVGLRTGGFSSADQRAFTVLRVGVRVNVSGSASRLLDSPSGSTRTSEIAPSSENAVARAR